MITIFSDRDRKAELLEKFILEFRGVRSELRSVRTPETILEIYLNAVLRLFGAKGLIIFSGADSLSIRALKVYRESGHTGEIPITISDGEDIFGADSGVIELFSGGNLDSAASRELDEDSPLFRKGVRSYLAFPYRYRGEKCVLMICNFDVGAYQDSIESYEACLAAIVMELLDATFFDERISELSDALIEAKRSGSRAELYAAAKAAIEFYAKYDFPVSDSIVADYLDTTLSRLWNPGRQAFPAEVRPGIIRRLKETIKTAGCEDIDEGFAARLLYCFEPGLGKSVPGDMTAKKMPLTSFTLSRAMMALSLELTEGDLIEKCRHTAAKLYKSAADRFVVPVEEISNPHDNEYIASLQARWMEIVTLCEGIRLQVLPKDQDTDRLHELLKEASPDTISLLWKALSFISVNNYAEHKNENMPQGGVNIESLWLKTWFGHYILNEETLGEILGDPVRSRLSKISFCHELGVFVLYLLHRLKTIGSKAPVIFPYGSEGAARALFYLIAEYGHSVCRIPRSVRIYEYINKAWETEAVLYFSRMPHRDHIFHSIDVALLGLLLMHVHSGGDEEAPLIDRIAPKFNNDRNSALANWLLATLFHDIGYSFVLYETTARVVDFFETPSFKEGSSIIENGVEEARKKILADAETRFPDIWKEASCPSGINHGLVSAIHLDHILGRHREEYRAAIHAIIAHDYKGFPVSCGDNPLSFLLLLCDHLQDWSRPRVDTSRMRKGVAASLDYKQPFEVDAYHNMAYLTLNLEIGQDRIRYADEVLKFVLVYKKPDNGNYEPVMLWLHTTYDLQRAARPTFWRTIEFAIEIVNEKEHLEIDNARDFVLQEKGGGMIANWLGAVTGCKSFVRHNTSGCGERLTIVLDNQDTEKIDDLRQDALYSSYTQWKRKLTDKVSLGKLKFLCDIDDG
ncbi:MAG: hypothetical protein HZA16_12430 [Nitrospirae bacterium]|nr:hypothetical protein [Nitrospirota bacterium]